MSNPFFLFFDEILYLIIMSEISRDEMKAVIRQAIDEKGRMYVIAAMVEGSIGYHTPSHASRLVDDFLEGKEKCYCERAMACYHDDLITMMYWDVYVFNHMEATDRRDRIIEECKAIMAMDSETQELIGLMWPTMSV
ncbi:MAG: hypothetical protein WC359_15500 [Dehalococcoidia bacterium]|jgi:hypothetical protein